MANLSDPIKGDPAFPVLQAGDEWMVKLSDGRVRKFAITHVLSRTVRTEDITDNHFATPKPIWYKIVDIEWIELLRTPT